RQAGEARERLRPGGLGVRGRVPVHQPYQRQPLGDLPLSGYPAGRRADRTPGQPQRPGAERRPAPAHPPSAGAPALRGGGAADAADPGARPAPERHPADPPAGTQRSAHQPAETLSRHRLRGRRRPFPDLSREREDPMNGQLSDNDFESLINDDDLTLDSAAEAPAAETAGLPQQDLSFFGKIPVNVTLEVASTEISLKELMEVDTSSVIVLDKLAGEPLDVKVN